MLNRLRWFIQRGKRGYADCDLWDLDSYLLRLMIDGIRKGEYLQSYQREEILAGLEAGIRIIEAPYEIENYTKALRVDEKLFKHGMKLLTDNFFGLWD